MGRTKKVIPTYLKAIDTSSSDEFDHESGDGGDRQFISALDRGFRVLQCFTSTTPELTTNDLMARTGLSKTTLFRLTYTLCKLGFLRYSERLSKFSLAPKLLTLASPLLARATIRQLAYPHMQALAKHAHGQVTLALGHRLDMHIVYVEIAQPADSSAFRPAVGTRISLSRTSTGRAYLAMLDQEECDNYIRTTIAADREKGERLKSRLEEARHDLKEHGFCLSHGDLHRELDAVAVPLYSPADDQIWVFTCAVPKYNLSGNQLVEDIGPRLVTLVHGVEMALGNVNTTVRAWA